MACDVNLIRIALEGRIEMLQLIFGSKDKGQAGRRSVSPAEWNSFSKSHNSRYQQLHPPRRRRAVKPKGGANG